MSEVTSHPLQLLDESPFAISPI